MSMSKPSNGSVVVVPASARKLVDSLKQVVNCPETEIYATLKDCNMDPDEAVTRLLSQDTFHKVKSKREKKKEVKDTNEYKSRGRSAVEPYLGYGGDSPHYFSSESAIIGGKYVYRKKTEAASYTSVLPSAPSMSGNNNDINSATTGISDHTSAENIGPSFVGGSGQLSMADIVKMGRRDNKVATAHDGFHNNECNSRFPDTNILEHQNGWPSIENPAASVLESVPEITVDCHVPSEDVVKSEYQDYEVNKDEETGENEGFMGSHSISTSREFPDDDSRGRSQYGNDLRSNMVDEGGASVSSFTRNKQQLSVELNERGLPSEGEANDPLTLQFPDHLKVNPANVSHLILGNFHAGKSILRSSSRAVTSLPVETSLEGRHSEVKIPSVSPPDTRELAYYNGDSFSKAASGTSFNRTRFDDESSASQSKPPKDAGVIDYRLLSSIHDYSADDFRLLNAAVSKLNLQRQNELQQAEKVDFHEYRIPSSVPDYSGGNMLTNKPTWGDDLRHLSSSQKNMMMHNQAPFSNDMHQYYPSSSLPSTLLAANVQPKHSRESELEYYAPKAAQYGVPASATSGSTMSMSEALKILSMQPGQHNLSGPSPLTGGPSLQQQLDFDPYSQPNRHSDPYASVFGGYTSRPQSSASMPSAFQKKMSNNSPYPQSLAAAPPVKCEINPSASNVPPFNWEVNPSAVNGHDSADMASRYGYGGPISEGTISGNFSMPPNTFSQSYLNYNDVLSSQYMDSLLTSHQQNDNSLMWPPDQGLKSRTIPAVQSSASDDYLGQGQQPSGFMQSGQTPSTNGVQGYQNYYPVNQIPTYGPENISQGKLRQY